MRTLQDLQANLDQLRGSMLWDTSVINLNSLQDRISKLERAIIVMHQILVMNLEHEIYVRKELTGEK